MLRAKRHVIKRLPEPYGPCVHTDVMHREFTLRNTSNCLVQMTRQYCQCTDVQHAVFEEPYDVDVFPYCGDIRFGIDWLQAKALCLNQLNTKVCATQNDLPCLEHQYLVKTSLIAWPALNQGFESFYEDYIEGKPSEEMFWPVREFMKHNCTHEAGCALLSHEADDVIRDNFLKFSFYLSDSYYTLTEEQPKLEIIVLLSQAASILNLWCGITMIIAIEVLELCYRLLKHALFDAEKSHHAPTECAMSERPRESTNL